MSRRKIGRLRELAADILAAGLPDWVITPEDVVPVTGFWLSQDVYRFQVITTAKKRASDGGPIYKTFGCWETLTEFVRVAAKNGFSVNEDGEIWPNYPPNGVRP